MTDRLRYLDNAEKIFVFDQVYPLSAASEQAARKKLSAFGMFAKLNLFNRPKEDTVLHSRHELRYEPFWHAVATRTADYSRELVYPVEIGNAFAHRVRIDGKDYPVTEQGGKRLISLPGLEYSHREIGFDEYADGLSRELKKGALANYFKKQYTAREQAVLELPEAIVPQLRLPTLLQQIYRSSSPTSSMRTNSRKMSSRSKKCTCTTGPSLPLNLPGRRRTRRA